MNWIVNSNLSDLLYSSGLTHQGCWEELDSYTQQCIETFAQLVVLRAVGLVISDLADPRDEPNNLLAKKILVHFGMERNDESTS